MNTKCGKVGAECLAAAPTVVDCSSASRRYGVLQHVHPQKGYHFLPMINYLVNESGSSEDD